MFVPFTGYGSIPARDLVRLSPRHPFHPTVPDFTENRTLFSARLASDLLPGLIVRRMARSMWHAHLVAILPCELGLASGRIR